MARGGSMLFVDDEGVYVEPSTIIALPWASAEDAYLRSNPVSFAYIHRATEIREFLAIKAGAE